MASRSRFSRADRTGYPLSGRCADGLVYPASHGCRPPRKNERRVPPPLGGRIRGPRRGQPCLVRTKTVRIIGEPACDFSSVAVVRHTGSSITSGPAENVKQRESRAEMPPRSIAATGSSTPSLPSGSTATALSGSGGDASVHIVQPPWQTGPEDPCPVRPAGRAAAGAGLRGEHPGRATAVPAV
jgi:hypothetical protein